VISLRARRERAGRQSILLALAPAILVVGLLLVLPMSELLVQSFRLFTPGRVGAQAGAPWTLANYLELLNPAFVGLLLDTFRISLIATTVGIAVSLPLAWCIVRRFSARTRALCVGSFVALFFLSILVRTYATELAFGPVGIFGPLLRAFGTSANSGWYLEFMIGAGLLNVLIPLSTLMLLGSVQNIDPRLVDAAQALGAPTWRAHLSITIPLARPGLVGAFMVGFTLSISSFLIPMVLGNGRILFISNTIYNRFSEIADYPSGAAISIVMLAVSLAAVGGLSWLAGRIGASR
jgi:putative spermidine/putrescine transport system permease protein